MAAGFSMLVWFLVAICVLVAVHEWGHFYAARLCGVKVQRFSIGFGSRLVTWTDRKGTEFALSAIPLGGYVKMLDEREGDVDPSELDQAFSRKPPWQRIAIAFAGPLANLVLAVGLFWLLALQGEIQRKPIVGVVDSDSVAAAAGLERGQEILSIDGNPVKSTRDVGLHLISRLGESGDLKFVVSYPDSNLKYELVATLDNWLRDEDEPDPIAGLGMRFYEPPATASEVMAGSPAQQAGMIAGDMVVEADGIAVASWVDWVEAVRAKPAQEMSIVVKRESELINLTVTPERVEADSGLVYGRVGVAMAPHKDLFRRIEYGVVEALFKGYRDTVDTVTLVFVSIKKLVLGEISTKNLSGPIGIAKVAGDSASAGIWPFIGFLAMISVYLGVLNLLPVPVLDGGHIVYHSIEWLKGSPVPEKIQMWGYQVGIVMVLGLMVVAFYNDIMRLSS